MLFRYKLSFVCTSKIKKQTEIRNKTKNRKSLLDHHEDELLIVVMLSNRADKSSELETQKLQVLVVIIYEMPSRNLLHGIAMIRLVKTVDTFKM